MIEKMNKSYDEEKIKSLVGKYKDCLDKVCFSTPEKEKLELLEEHLDLYELLEMLVTSNIELNYIFEQCPDSIYVTDEKGMTQRVNKAFEETTDIKREAVIGRNVADLEEDGILRPSVCSLVIKEQRKVSLLQEGKKGTAVVTGVPICNEQGRMYKIVTNARSLEQLNEITSYVEQSAARENTGDQQIVAESKAMKHILEITDQVADVDSTVLITGESGVGKGVLARRLHDESSRNSSSFVQINCGAIPEALLESELFGYESGAFTGADRKGKKGLIELAHKGTLFLDEIGELPMLLQVKLLDFLQSRKIIRVGGTKENFVDVRVIAATNKDLKGMVSRGEFRDDLFYRLHVVPIVIPPLRERPDDIYPAACYFARKFRKKYHKEFEFSDEFLETLLHYDWMGNMRELENYMERMVVMSGGRGDSKLLEPTPGDSQTNNSAMNHLKLAERLEKYEASLVKEAYEKTHNTYKVAELLGISQPSAFRKVRKYIKDLEK